MSATNSPEAVNFVRKTVINKEKEEKGSKLHFQEFIMITCTS